MSLHFNHTPEQLDTMVGKLVSTASEYDVPLDFFTFTHRPTKIMRVYPEDIMVFVEWFPNTQQYFTVQVLHPEHGMLRRQYFFIASLFGFNLVNEHA